MPDKDWQAEIARLQALDRKARALLGVSEAADRAAIRKAFRRASLAHHPDVNNDGDAARRFNRIRCAYRFLTTGETCPALDEVPEAPSAAGDGTYRRDSPWGYWCWWRDKYFGA